MKKIAIFGATGATGLCAVDAALKKGLGVIALARDPTGFPNELQSKLEVVKGNVLNLNDVRKTVKGVDGVVIVLGCRNDFSPTTVMSEGTRNIVVAMSEAGIKPVSACLSAFLFSDLQQVLSPFREITKEHRRMLEVLEASDREWIAVLPPKIEGTNVMSWQTIQSLPRFGIGYACLSAFLIVLFPIIWVCSKISSATEKPQTEPSHYILQHGSSPGKKIKKYDLGYFLVDCLGQPEHRNQLVGIANVK